jgi:hypothetical protein
MSWEIVQTLKRLDPSQDYDYLRFLGDYLTVGADVYNTVSASLSDVMPHSLVMLLENGRRIRTDFLRLLIEHPAAYLQNKMYVISRVLGIREPLRFLELDEIGVASWAVWLPVHRCQAPAI